MMTSNVFGSIAAANLGYAKVELQETIAEGSPGAVSFTSLRPTRPRARKGGNISGRNDTRRFPVLLWRPARAHAPGIARCTIGTGNQAAAALLGCGVSDLPGLSLADLACGPPETLARLLSRFSRSG